MVSHRLRDTFAVDLLEKGVLLEEVSKLLGHESIKTTERHYAKWVKGRQDRPDSLVTGTWAAEYGSAENRACMYAMDRQILGSWGLEPQISAVSRVQQ
jgi:integrase-like protein